jgi:hypothetical protein
MELVTDVSEEHTSALNRESATYCQVSATQRHNLEDHCLSLLYA